MNGAREYYDLFKTGQYGKLWIQCGSHARGKTFHIFVLPERFVVISHQPFPNLNSVEVYGMISGNRGWTESYGWLHKGPWVADFDKLVKEKRVAKNRRVIKNFEETMIKNKKEDERIKNVLDQY